jgi:hypothetical protein
VTRERTQTGGRRPLKFGRTLGEALCEIKERTWDTKVSIDPQGPSPCRTCRRTPQTFVQMSGLPDGRLLKVRLAGLGT